MVVAGAAEVASTATGAAATGTTGAATGAGVAAGAAALRAAGFLASTAGAGAGAATGAGVTATGASSVFLATRLGLAAEEAVAEFIILVPVEEFISIKRTILTLWTGSESIFIPNLSIWPPGLTRETFFFERLPGHDGYPTCV